ncbi:MAG: hypothetical protein J6P32_07510 [Stomatobaculum sp.]|nr:hypothetical protein [Stomatobaculum sp.]
MSDKTELFEYALVPRAMAVMAIPTIFSQLITLIYNMADTWFLGLTNDPYKVAASSLVLTLYMFTIGIANLFGTGGGSLISRLLGARQLVFNIPLLLLLDRFFGMDGLVWTQFIADIFTVILTYAVYWKLYKKPRGKALA